jgi:azurin
MFKIEYERADGISNWLKTEYYDPDDADQIAKHLLRGSGNEIVRTTVVEQAGYVYSQHVDYRRKPIL